VGVSISDECAVFQVSNFGSRVEGGVQGLGFRVYNLRCGPWDFGLGWGGEGFGI